MFMYSIVNYHHINPFHFQAPSEISLEKFTEVHLLLPSQSFHSKPNSFISRESSERSTSSKHTYQPGIGVSNLPQQFSPPETFIDSDQYTGLDVAEVIKRLRLRLSMSASLDAIANGDDPDEDENNLNRRNIKEDDGKFLYCLPKNRAMRAARYNPYNLICVNSSEAQTCAQYFMVSASSVTQVC